MKPLTIGLLMLALATATPGRSAAVTNKITMPFSGVFAGADENLAVTGNVVVKTVHNPGDPSKPITMSVKLDKKTSTVVGMTSGQTYKLKGPSSSKFKYVFPTGSSVSQLQGSLSFGLCCRRKCILCFPRVMVTVAFNPDTGEIMSDGSGTGALMPPPEAGSCSAVAQVCN
jgi:hypothetical protein